jgi:hypothetical protein
MANIVMSDSPPPTSPAMLIIVQTFGAMTQAERRREARIARFIEEVSTPRQLGGRNLLTIGNYLGGLDAGDAPTALEFRDGRLGAF